jgi:hypothetical protein
MNSTIYAVLSNGEFAKVGETGVVEISKSVIAMLGKDVTRMTLQKCIVGWCMA